MLLESEAEKVDYKGAGKVPVIVDSPCLYSFWTECPRLGGNLNEHAAEGFHTARPVSRRQVFDVLDEPGIRNNAPELVVSRCAWNQYTALENIAKEYCMYFCPKGYDEQMMEY